MPGRPYPSYPEADRASPEYAYIDPKNAFYSVAKLPREYHPLDAWKILGKSGADAHIYSTFYQSLLGTIGCVTSLAVNYSNNAPLWSSAPRTVALTLLGVALGQMGWNYSQKNAANRDALVQKFLEDHYDEFPMVKRVKYGEVFMPWRVSR